jgi:quinoprotein glucose dehydrogenase
VHPRILLVAAGCLASGAGTTVAVAQTSPSTITASATATTEAAGTWSAYGGGPGGERYSPLTQINRSNVARLRVAWTYRTGDLARTTEHLRGSGFEATPLFVDGTLYLDTPFGRVIALDPERGTPRWSYDPKVDITKGYGDFTSRGVSTWLDPRRGAGAPCHRRIFVATIDARLIALDAATGKPCADFGAGGTVNLRVGVRNGIDDFAEYEETSPPAIMHDLVIVGSGVADNNRTTAPSGVVRAFDARTGALRWSWDPVPQDSTDPAWRTWQGPTAHRTGAANAWSIITVDTARDLVFVPTGSASPDYYGGERRGSNLYANSIVALRGSTGKVVWHFQVVHHDLWDYDVPASPALMTVRRAGKNIPAVVVATKVGHLFVLNRETGVPLFPVEERPVPQSDVPGESSWPTQPVPTLPKPLVPQRLTAGEAWGVTEADRQWCRAQIASLRSDGPFTPPSVRGSLIVPGNIGGSNWGGVAIDQAHGLIIAPTNRLPAVVRLIPRDRYKAMRDTMSHGELAPQHGTPYAMWRDFLLSPSSHLPCNPPPWGTLTAVDAATGAVRWEVPLGTIPWAPKGAHLEHAGSINLGGAIVTAGGLAFIGAALDPHLRAFDVETGKELWAGNLPVSARATPMTYRAANGTQYVVIAAGGHAVADLPVGDYLVAFALR